MTFVTESSVPTENLLKALNDILPAAVRVLEVSEAPADPRGTPASVRRTLRAIAFLP